jgi:hypothetical protein
MKEKAFKLVSKFFITLAIIYWGAILLTVMTGCKTNKDCSNCSGCNTQETTISLDPMDTEQHWEREEFLRHFD